MKSFFSEIYMFNPIYAPFSFSFLSSFILSKTLSVLLRTFCHTIIINIRRTISETTNRKVSVCTVIGTFITCNTIQYICLSHMKDISSSKRKKAVSLSYHWRKHEDSFCPQFVCSSYFCIIVYHGVDIMK